MICVKDVWLASFKILSVYMQSAPRMSRSETFQNQTCKSGPFIQYFMFRNDRGKAPEKDV